MFDCSCFIKSAILTFTILLAIGPVFMTIVNNFLTKGPAFGIVSAIGVILIDWVYIVCSIFFLEKVKNSLHGSSIMLSIFASLFLFYLSYSFFTIKKINIKKKVDTSSLLKTFVSMLILTASSPTTIITYAGVFSSFATKFNNPTSMMLGGFFGTAFFYFILINLLWFFRKNLNEKKLLLLGRVGGLIIFCFAFLNLMNIVPSLIKG